jgi:hypothetical protein
MALREQAMTPIDEKLQDLMQRCKEVAALVGEGREVFAECSYCHSQLPLWEALFTQQLAGVLAHVACPGDLLAKVVGEAAPIPEFDYQDFIRAIEERMATERPTQISGVIEKTK